MCRDGLCERSLTVFQHIQSKEDFMNNNNSGEYISTKNRDGKENSLKIKVRLNIGEFRG